MAIRRKRNTSGESDLENNARLVADLRSAIYAIERHMPREDPQSWFIEDRVAAGDTFAQLEFEAQFFGYIDDMPDDDVTADFPTIVAAAARRSVRALHRILRDIEGMGYVKASDILSEVVVAPNVETLTDIGMVQEYLENVVTEVREEALDCVLDVQDLESLRGTSVKSRCNECATDAVDIIVSAIGVLDDPAEAEELLGRADRTVLTNDALSRAVALVILGHIEHSFYENRERYERAASSVAGELEIFDLVRVKGRIHEVRVVMERLRKAWAELVQAGRETAADLSASSALEDRLGSLLRQ